MGTFKSHRADVAQRLIAGLRKAPPSSSINLGGTKFTPAEVESFLQVLVDLRAAVDSAKAVVRAKVLAEASLAPPLHAKMAALIAVVRAAFENSPDILADYGLEPRKVAAPQTLEQKASAVAKRAATRRARHTMGPRQKQAIKGTITTIVSTSSAPHPPAAGAAPGSATSRASPPSAEPAIPLNGGPNAAGGAAAPPS